MRQGIDSLIANVRSVFFGSDRAIEQALTTLLAGEIFDAIRVAPESVTFLGEGC